MEVLLSDGSIWEVAGPSVPNVAEILKDHIYSGLKKAVYVSLKGPKGKTFVGTLNLSNVIAVGKFGIIK